MSVFTARGGNEINERVACGDGRRGGGQNVDVAIEEFVDLYTVRRAYWFNISSNNFNNPGKCSNI